MTEKQTLESYLKKKEEALVKLKGEISFLKEIKVPLTIEKNNKKIKFYSEDYSMAQNFVIEKRDEPSTGGHFSSYDGGYNTRKYAWYPQFYFSINNKKVLIQHKNFYEDDKIIFKQITEVSGWGDCRKESKKDEKYLDEQKVLTFFKTKGVNDNLIKKLEHKIKEIKKFS